MVGEELLGHFLEGGASTLISLIPPYFCFPQKGLLLLEFPHPREREELGHFFRKGRFPISLPFRKEEVFKQLSKRNFFGRA